MATQKRLLNIATRMLFKSEVFYGSSSPRMTWKEYLELLQLGFRVQSEHPHPPECRMYYMPSYWIQENTENFNKVSAPNNASNGLADNVCPRCHLEPGVHYGDCPIGG